MQILDGVDCEVPESSDRLETLRGSIPGDVEAAQVSAFFRLLGDPHRVRVLFSLIEAGELNVGSIASVVGASEAKVSQALRLLRSAGLVASRREGRSIFYRVTDSKVRLILDLSSLRGEQIRSTVGSVELISIAAKKRDPMLSAESVEAVVGMGLVGDRNVYREGRQVSVQTRAELDIAQEQLGRPIRSDLTRRNITLDTGRLPRNPGERLVVGDVELEVHSDAPPCEVMTEAFGEGALEALTGRAGVHCRVISGGTINVGDSLYILEADSGATDDD